MVPTLNASLTTRYPRPRHTGIRALLALACVLAAGVLGGCGKDATPTAPEIRRPVSFVSDTQRYRPQRLGAPVGDQPWIAHLITLDLDGDGLLDVVACEAKANTINWVRQTAPGQFEEIVIADDMRAPVHVEGADMDTDGDLDLIVSSMGYVFPNNDKIGSIFILEQTAPGAFTPHLIIENIDRVTDARAADFDGDGQLDLAVGQFGYDQGEVRWMRRTGPWTFASEVLLKLSGTVNVVIADFDDNGALDFAALVSQQYEEMHVFFNDGSGNFRSRVVWGSTNEDYSSSGMSLGDVNRDGRPDLIFSNGDGFGPTPDPGPKPWHGVQWLENTGGGSFRFHRIGDLGGAYAPMVADVDADGDNDIVALAAFNDWSKPGSVALAWFANDGAENFTPHVLAYKPTHLTTLAIGAFDGSGYPSLVTGGFHAYPPYDRQSRILLWRPRAAEETP